MKMTGIQEDNIENDEGHNSAQQARKSSKVDYTKYLIWIVVFAGAIAALVFFSKPSSNLYTTSIGGQAQITRAGQTLYLLANEPLYKGDTIVSTKGKTVLNFNTEDSSISLDEGTTIVIDFDAGNFSAQKSFRVLTGKASFQVQKQNLDQSMHVLTKAAALNTKGTEFSIAANDDSAIIELNRGLGIIINNQTGEKFELPEKYKVELQDENFPELASIGKVIIPKTLNFTLINPEDNSHIEKYFSLTNGPIIALSDLPQTGFDLRANVVNSAIISRLSFTLTSISGKIMSTFNDDTYPFSMTGGQAMKATPGTYILTTDIYTPKSTNPVHSTKFKFTLK
jgi:hypothetical protein